MSLDMSDVDAHMAGKGVTNGVKEERPYGEEDTPYFTYYAQLTHQAQMLQDVVRTSAYHRAIHNNAATSFKNKIVMDVGAGSGILSYFAAQAGASKVMAVEASNMVNSIKRMAADAERPLEARNPFLKGKLEVMHSKVEDLPADIEVDTLISECLGVFLVHERMVESFISARRFLRPGGQLFPSAGTICVAPFMDQALHDETINKAGAPWLNKNFYGVDLTPFHEAAVAEAFEAPVVGVFPPQMLLSASSPHIIDFGTVTQEELERFEIDFEWVAERTGILHGIAGWFDLTFPSPPPGTSTTGEAIDFSQFTASNFISLPTGPTEDGTNGALPTTTAVSSAMSTAAGIMSQMSAAAASFQPNSTTVEDPTYMTTSPLHTPTHWQQVRFLLQEPLAVNRSQVIKGKMICVVNESRSYTISAKLGIAGAPSASSSAAFDPLHRSGRWRLDRQVYHFSQYT